ncbi:hypothetical protein CR513_39903, partial [Mucuna pruriens]
MSRFVVMREFLSKYEDKLCLNLERIITSLRLHKLFIDRFIVDQNAKSYSCNFWELVGRPYRHVVATTTYKGENLNKYVHFYYDKMSYEKCYGHTLSHINVENNWLVKGLEDQKIWSQHEKLQESFYGASQAANGFKVPTSESNGSQPNVKVVEIHNEGNNVSQVPSNVGSELPTQGSQVTSTRSEHPTHGSQVSIGGSELPTGSQLPTQSSQVQTRMRLQRRKFIHYSTRATSTTILMTTTTVIANHEATTIVIANHKATTATLNEEGC